MSNSRQITNEFSVATLARAIQNPSDFGATIIVSYIQDAISNMNHGIGKHSIFKFFAGPQVCLSNYSLINRQLGDLKLKDQRQ
jgi:hypothetical protein